MMPTRRTAAAAGVVGPLSPWFRSSPLRRTGRCRLFCFPHAGAGASLFRAWYDVMPRDIDLRAVQFPGREARITEPLFTSMAELVDALADNLGPWIGESTAFFGHSLGALVAYELIRTLRRRGRPQPALLFASGSRAPHMPDRFEPASHLPADALWRYVQMMDGLPDELADNPELMALMLPIVRADFTMYETYAYVPEEPIACPIVALAGVRDPCILVSDVDAWCEHTTSYFARHCFDGAHFFLRTASAPVVDVVVRELSHLGTPVG